MLFFFFRFVLWISSKRVRKHITAKCFQKHTRRWQLYFGLLFVYRWKKRIESHTMAVTKRWLICLISRVSWRRNEEIMYEIVYWIQCLLVVCVRFGYCCFHYLDLTQPKIQQMYTHTFPNAACLHAFCLPLSCVNVWRYSGYVWFETDGPTNALLWIPSNENKRNWKRHVFPSSTLWALKAKNKKNVQFYTNNTTNAK